MTARLTELVCDGGDDVRPEVSARELLLAAGHLHHHAQVACALGLTQMEVTNAHLEDGMRSATRWAERHAGLSVAAVSELRRVSRGLARFPVLGSAFLAGRIRSGELAAVDRVIPARFHGEALAGAVGFLSDVQHELLAGIEAALGPRELGRFLARVRDRLDRDGPEPDLPGASGSEVRLRERHDGWWDLVGLLNPSDGAIWATTLGDRDQRNLRARKDDADPGGVRDDRPVAVRHAAALTELLRDGAGASKPGRVGLFLHLDLDDLVARGAERPGVVARTEANLDVSDGTLWSLLAGADVTPIITRTGTPLSFGRTRRLAPDILRRALALRDETCFLPGCDAPPNRHDSHHARYWDDGGTTDPHNNRGACSLHHHLIHDRGWRLEVPPDGAAGDPIVLRPDGSTYDPAPIWRTRRERRIAELARSRLDALGHEFARAG